MKMSDQLFGELQAAILPYQQSNETVRQRWDALWLAVDAGRFDIRKCYADGLNDSHIDTALKTILRLS